MNSLSIVKVVLFSIFLWANLSHAGKTTKERVLEFISELAVDAKKLGEPKANYVFNGYKIWIKHFYIESEDEYEFDVFGAQGKPCLEFIVSVQRDVGIVDWLGEQIPKQMCPGPSEGKGNFYLKLVDELATKLKLLAVELEDASKVKCKKNGNVMGEGGLSFIKIFQSGKTWYEGKGYKPYKEITNKLYTYSKYRARIKKFRLLNIFKINEALHSHELGLKKELEGEEKKEADEEIKSFKQYRSFMLARFKEAKPGETDLAVFFAWLWKDDCESYIDLFDQFFTVSKWSQQTKLPYYELYGKIKQDVRHMKKEFYQKN